MKVNTPVTIFGSAPTARSVVVRFIGQPMHGVWASGRDPDPDNPSRRLPRWKPVNPRIDSEWIEWARQNFGDLPDERTAKARRNGTNWEADIANLDLHELPLEAQSVIVKAAQYVMQELLVRRISLESEGDIRVPTAANTHRNWMREAKNPQLDQMVDYYELSTEEQQKDLDVVDQGINGIKVFLRLVLDDLEKMERAARSPGRRLIDNLRPQLPRYNQVVIAVEAERSAAHLAALDLLVGIGTVYQDVWRKTVAEFGATNRWRRTRDDYWGGAHLNGRDGRVVAIRNGKTFANLMELNLHDLPSDWQRDVMRAVRQLLIPLLDAYLIGDAFDEVKLSSAILNEHESWTMARRKSGLQVPSSLARAEDKITDPKMRHLNRQLGLAVVGGFQKFLTDMAEFRIGSVPLAVEQYLSESVSATLSAYAQGHEKTTGILRL